MFGPAIFDILLIVFWPGFVRQFFLADSLGHFMVCVLVCFFVRKVLCMQFGTLTWIIDVFAVISEWHFNMVAASHCCCCSQCVGRGQGSAAGAAEDHMKCLELLGILISFMEKGDWLQSQQHGAT